MTLSSSAGAPVTRRRWVIAALLFAAAVLNYVDRTVLSLLAPTIQADLGISDVQYAHVLDAFLIAYTIAYLFSGRIVDLLGSRVGMLIFLGWWSAANALTAFSRSAFSLGFWRAMLGLGEAGGWTSSPKAVSEWFPPTERGLVAGIYSMGGSVGATIAPLMIIPIAVHHSWQWAFVITGMAGFLWLIPWLLINRRPPWPSPPRVPPNRGAELALWKSVLRQPAVWRLTTARLLSDSVWYFYLFWMPKYLHDVRGMSQQELGILWVVFLAADIGFVSGGFFSGRLVKRGISPARARLWIMLGTAIIGPLSPFVALSPSLVLTIALSALIAAVHASWLSNVSALIIDIIPAPIMATTFGVIAAGSAVGGIAMNQIVSWLVGQYSYTPAFVIMAFMHPLALLLVWKLGSLGAVGEHQLRVH